MKNKIILGCLAAATCEILFGLSFIFTKSITAQVSDLALILGALSPPSFLSTFISYSADVG